MCRTGQDGDAYGRVFEDTGEPQGVRFLDGSHLRAQHLRLDARDQLTAGERLYQIVVSAGLQPFDARLLAGTSGHEDHRHCAGTLVFPKCVQQLEPVETRHHDVRDHDVRARFTGTCEGGRAVPDRIDQPPLAKEPADVLAHVGIVVGYENA